MEQAAAAEPADLVELGILRGAFGLKGWSHVQAHAGESAALRQSRHWWLSRPPLPDGRSQRAVGVEITSVRAQGAALVAKWKGCEDPERADGYKGWRVSVSRSEFPALPDGQYYWVDLIGTQVVNRAGQVLGTVQGLRNNGAHDLLEVAREAQAGPTLIPLVAAYVDGVDLAARRVRVDWDPSW